MKSIQLKAAKRDEFGKKASKATRRNAHIPCVLYGGGDTVHFSIDEKEVRPLIYSPSSYIVEFDIDGVKETGVMGQVQFHPVREQILHIDFSRVIPGKPVVIEVPVRLTGNSAGVKLGGKLTLSKRKIAVSAMAENLPDELVVDVTELELGKSIFVGDLKFDNLTLLTPASTAVCAVNMTRAARGAAQAEAAEK
jgi:large subunit ribosomal protein L25